MKFCSFKGRWCVCVLPVIHSSESAWSYASPFHFLWGGIFYHSKLFQLFSVFVELWKIVSEVVIKKKSSGKNWDRERGPTSARWLEIPSDYTLLTASSNKQLQTRTLLSLLCLSGMTSTGPIPPDESRLKCSFVVHCRARNSVWSLYCTAWEKDSYHMLNTALDKVTLYNYRQRKHSCECI